jgi:tetratricopeptide (TPR) repeat protein
MQAGWYFMGLGWYLALIAAFALMVCGGTGMERSAIRRARRVTYLLVLGVLAFFLYRPVLGEHDLAIGARAEAQWHPQEAERWYRKAMQDDGWNALDLGVHQRMGALDQALGRSNTPDYQLYRAEFMVDEQKYPEAIEQYELLARAGGPLGKLAQDRADELAVTHGAALFDAGAYGAAVIAWQHALVNHPSLWIAAFYLSRAYFAMGRYDDAVAVAQRSIDASSDPQFLANLYCNLGDAQVRIGNQGDAHNAYGKSYYYNYVPNWRAITSLTGSVTN